MEPQEITFKPDPPTRFGPRGHQLTDEKEVAFDICDGNNHRMLVHAVIPFSVNVLYAFGNPFPKSSLCNAVNCQPGKGGFPMWNGL
jgi:hypothetical protein